VASPLENLSGPGKPLRKEPPDEKEFSGLKRSALARLADSAKNSNSLESRFNLAYNAAHELCLAALRWHTSIDRMIELFLYAEEKLKSG
jgi:hypothetical protein